MIKNIEKQEKSKQTALNYAEPKHCIILKAKVLWQKCRWQWLTLRRRQTTIATASNTQQYAKSRILTGPGKWLESN